MLVFGSVFDEERAGAMCGIAGIFDCRGRGEIDRVLLRRMTDILEHRGPDGDGFHYAPGVGFGHRRRPRDRGPAAI